MNRFRRYINGSKFFQLMVTIILVIFLCIQLYPLIYIISASFSDPYAVAQGELVLFPIDFTLEGYKHVLQYEEIWIGYGNTILYTILGTLLNLAVTLPCAYALSRHEIVGKNFYFY